MKSPKPTKLEDQAPELRCGHCGLELSTRDELADLLMSRLAEAHRSIGEWLPRFLEHVPGRSELEHRDSIEALWFGDLGRIVTDVCDELRGDRCSTCSTLERIHTGDAGKRMPLRALVGIGLLVEHGRRAA